MTKLAIVTDVHADLHALQDALKQIEQLGCEHIVCAGDLVDYGVFPDETIALLRDRGIPCVRGNHDRWALGINLHILSLSAASRKFLSSLPTKWDKTIDGVRVAVRHGSPEDDMEGIYPDATTDNDLRKWLTAVNADILIVGHTHIAFARKNAIGDMIVNPGALLRDSAARQEATPMVWDATKGEFVPEKPRQGGTFGVLELPSRRFTVHRASDGQVVKTW